MIAPLTGPSQASLITHAPSPTKTPRMIQALATSSQQLNNTPINQPMSGKITVGMVKAIATRKANPFLLSDGFPYWVSPTATAMVKSSKLNPSTSKIKVTKSMFPTRE